jgi:hypothetical protein
VKPPRQLQDELASQIKKGQEAIARVRARFDEPLERAPWYYRLTMNTESISLCLRHRWCLEELSLEHETWRNENRALLQRSYATGTAADHYDRSHRLITAAVDERPCSDLNSAERARVSRDHVKQFFALIDSMNDQLRFLEDLRQRLVDTTSSSHPSKGVVAFLCHSSVDKRAVRTLYGRLHRDGFKPWLDEEDLAPGQDWELEIRRAIRKAHVVLVCLSQDAADRAGYLQKEIRFALDVADEQPEGSVFVIPVRLEECTVPDRLGRWQQVDLFEDRGYERLVRSLNSVQH